MLLVHRLRKDQYECRLIRTGLLFERRNRQFLARFSRGAFAAALSIPFVRSDRDEPRGESGNAQHALHQPQEIVPPAREGHRRQFSEADKRRIVEEAARPAPAEVAHGYMEP